MWLLASAQQTYLDQAAQMQALSFTVHIPLVCFGIALPSMIVFVEWLHLRSGEEVYRTIARRWTRIMAALFAVGVITGTILSFEMGMLWPGFMSTFGGVFGLGFAIEGFSFFLEAIFIGIYVYGWGRLSPRAHLLSAIPIVIAGFTGSLMVISVNAWMQHPSGFKLVHGRVVDVHPLAALFGNSFLWNELIHMYLAAYIVAGFLMATPYAIGRLRGRFGRYERTACAIPLTIAAVVSPIQILIGDWAARDVATEQPTKLAAMEGLAKTTRGASEHLLGWYVNGQIKFGIGIPDLLSILAFHNLNAKVQGLDAVPISQRPPVNIERVSFQLMVALGTGFAALGVLFLFLRLAPADHAQAAVVLPAGGRRRAGVGGCPDRRLVRDRDRPPAVDGLPGDDHRRSGHARTRSAGRLRRACGHLLARRAVVSCGCCAAWHGRR